VNIIAPIVAHLFSIQRCTNICFMLY